MGNILGGYSNSRKHCLVEFPHIQTRTEEDIISIRLQIKYTNDGQDCYLVPEQKYPYDHSSQTCYFMSDMASKLKTNEKGLIMGIFLLFAQNELSVPLEFTLRDLFTVHEKVLNKKGHPDNTGKLTIFVDAQQRGLQPPDKQLLYASTAENDAALSYAGLEDRILKPRSIPIPEPPKEKEEEHSDEDIQIIKPEQQEDQYELFTDEDEMVKFILQNRERFAPTSHDMFKVDFEERDPTKDITHYHISKKFLNDVRNYFSDAVFPCLHYTKFIDTRMSLALTQEQRAQIISLHPMSGASEFVSPSISMTLQINSLIITTGGANVTPKAIKRHY